MRTLTISGLALSVVLLFAYLIVCWVVVDIALVANQNSIHYSQSPQYFGIQNVYKIDNDIDLDVNNINC